MLLIVIVLIFLVLLINKILIYFVIQIIIGPTTGRFVHSIALNSPDVCLFYNARRCVAPPGPMQQASERIAPSLCNVFLSQLLNRIYIFQHTMLRIHFFHRIFKCNSHTQLQWAAERDSDHANFIQQLAIISSEAGAMRFGFALHFARESAVALQACFLLHQLASS